MSLKKGSTGAAVSALKAQLNVLGAGLNDSLQNQGVFGPRVEAEVKAFQRREGLAVDGVVGPKTKAALEAAVLRTLDQTKGRGDLPAPVKTDKGDWNAPWVFANIDLLGRYETDPVLNARYVPEWAKEGLPGYKTLAGNTHAWCSVREIADKRKVGVNVKGLNAGAASHSKWGKKCPFWFGCTLDIEHLDKNGNGSGRHVGDFLYWIDEAKKIAAVLGGNQGNQFSIAATDLSGRPRTNRLKTGPRWGIDLPDGFLVSKAEVLARYPYLKVGGNMGSTR